MCGIVGLVDHKGQSSTQILESMTNKQMHRGPDAQGVLFLENEKNQLGLGHRRLSIIDVSAHANQPMTFEHLTIVYNGEVYNFAEIRQELSNDYVFTTESDTEVILKAFHKWGIGCINKFRGMFAFCVLDKDKNKLTLVRDRVGVKPLYIYHSDSLFLFASEIKSFHYHPGFKAELCETGMHLFFQHGYIAAPYSIFSGVKKVKPGHYIEYDIPTHTFTEYKYWDLSYHYRSPKLAITFSQAKEELNRLLIESFSLRMIADVPVGVLLSGGIDSSLITAILQHHSGSQLNTFTMGFANKSYDESGYAREIAKALNTNHHEEICTWQDAESIIHDLPHMYDEPFADTSCIPTALISKFARKKVTVALSGDGGDELFCGYRSYEINAKRFDQLNKLPFKKQLNKILNKIPDNMMSLYGLKPEFYNRYLKMKWVLSQDQLEDKYKSITRTFTPSEVNHLLSNERAPTIKHEICTKLPALERMMLADFNYYLPDDLLVKVDRASMRYSLEGREPLLDHHILEYAAQLPIAFKKNKFILKEILKQYLSPTYFERKKQGFGVPVNHWLRKELLPIVDKYLDKSRLIKQGLFNVDYITKLKHAFFKNEINDNKIWTLLAFQIWHEAHFPI